MHGLRKLVHGSASVLRLVDGRGHQLIGLGRVIAVLAGHGSQLLQRGTGLLESGSL